MSTIEHKRTMDIRNCIIAVFLIVSGVLAMHVDTANAVEDVVPDPEYISGQGQKEGNRLYEYNFAVFTKESMEREINNKKNDQHNRQKMIAGLFGESWPGDNGHDAEAQEIIKSAGLFSDIDTGIEASGESSDTGGISGDLLKKLAVILAAGVLCMVIIRIKRNRYENKRNPGA